MKISVTPAMSSAISAVDSPPSLGPDGTSGATAAAMSVYKGCSPGQAARHASEGCAESRRSTSSRSSLASERGDGGMLAFSLRAASARSA
eukprot:5546408-Pyramimonas_sp.AAC.1